MLRYRLPSSSGSRSNMFCTTLRKRPDVSTVLPLLASNTNPKLRGKLPTLLPLLSSNQPSSPETVLQTHDLALPSHHQHLFLFLLLTPSSLQNPQPQLSERISRFSTLVASPTPVIAFLLTTNTNDTHANATPTDENGMQAYMTLQTL